MSSANDEAAGYVAEADALSLACLMLLEQLTPLERTAFLLQRVFGRSSAEIAVGAGVSHATCERLLQRARRVMTDAKPAIEADRRQRREVTHRFLIALHERDEGRLAALLAPDAVGYLSAAEPPAVGRLNVARVLVQLNGDVDPDQLALSIEVSGGLVQTVRR